MSELSAGYCKREFSYCLIFRSFNFKCFIGAIHQFSKKNKHWQQLNNKDHSKGRLTSTDASDI